MEENISKKTEELIKSKAHEAPQFKEFIRAIEEYQKLIEKGLAVRRGYNLMTNEEIYNPALNCSYLQPSR